MFNLIFVHLLKQTEHSKDCVEKPGRGLVCAEDCGTARFLAWLDEPLTTWEIEAEAKRQARVRAFMRGEITAS